MRVLFTQWCAVGNRTGVGHYARQLLQHLRQIPGETCTGYPSERWLTWTQRVRSCYHFLASLKPRWQRSRKSRSLRFLRQLWRWPARRARQAYQSYMEHLHREAFFGNAFDLYHEPNHIAHASTLPTVTTVHDLSVLLHPEWHPQARVLWFEKNFPNTLQQSTQLIAVSEFTRKQMLAHLGLPANRVTTVHNAARPEFRPLAETVVARTLHKWGLPARYLLYVGTIEPRKNILRLMQAYCALPESLRSDWPLLLVGQWGWNVAREQAYYQDEARHRGVRQVGYLPDEDLPALYNGARALLYPSLYEGFGLPPLEMLACGGAVLASRIEPIIEVVGSQGHLVAPEDTEGWREALERVLLEEDWWQDLRQGAEQTARHFSWQRCAAETMQVYRKALPAERTNALPFPWAA